MHAHWHRLDIGGDAGEPRRFPGVVQGVGQTARQVVENAARQNPALLQNDADLTPP